MTRLRQVALASTSLTSTVHELQSTLAGALAEPFSDPGVGEFGLENAVFAVGDTFLEVVSPLPGAEASTTAAGRYLAKRGRSAGGYMALFQVPDTAAARARVAALGVRVVWQADLDDISGTHLHPKDVPGAILSLDTPRPASSWRWGGFAWVGGAPAFEAGAGVVGITVSCASPSQVAARWAEVLDEPLAGGGEAIVLDGGRQRLDFVAGAEPGFEAITEVALAVPGRAGEVEACGVRFSLAGASESHRGSQ